VQTVFQGTTVRGLLLNAYAFWQMGQIALIASIVSFVAGVIMLILAGLGFWHRRRTPAEAELNT
jgi:predicted small integral membrane protein